MGTINFIKPDSASPQTIYNTFDAVSTFRSVPMTLKSWSLSDQIKLVHVGWCKFFISPYHFYELKKWRNKRLKLVLAAFNLNPAHNLLSWKLLTDFYLNSPSGKMRWRRSRGVGAGQGPGVDEVDLDVERAQARARRLGSECQARMK